MKVFEKINEIIRKESNEIYGFSHKEGYPEVIISSDLFNKLGDKLKNIGVIVTIDDNIIPRKRYNGYLVVKEGQDVNKDIAQSKYVEMTTDRLKIIYNNLMNVIKKGQNVNNTIAINTNGDKINVLIESKDNEILLPNIEYVKWIVRPSGFINNMIRVTPKAKHYFYIGSITRKGKVQFMSYSQLVEVDNSYKEFI